MKDQRVLGATKPLTQFAFLGPVSDVCTRCGVTTGVNCLVATDDQKAYLCDFCIELAKDELPEIYKSFLRLIKKQQADYIKSNPSYLEMAKEREYELLITHTEALLSKANKVMNGTPTNDIEYKLAKLIKRGAAVGGDLKLASNKIKKQKQYLEVIKSLMKKHGEMGL